MNDELTEPTKLTDERLEHIRAAWDKWKDYTIHTNHEAAREFIDYIPELLEHVEALERERDEAFLEHTAAMLHLFKSMPDAPKRRYEMALQLSADSFDDLQMALDTISINMNIARGSDDELVNGYNSVSGSPRTGWIINVVFKPEMNHELYSQEIKAWLARKRDERATPPADGDGDDSDGE